MKYRTRIIYTDAQKALMWDRWQKGLPARYWQIVRSASYYRAANTHGEWRHSAP